MMKLFLAVVILFSVLFGLWMMFTYQKANSYWFEMRSSYFTGRHLLNVEEEVIIEEDPVPKLKYWIEGDIFPYVEGGNVLLYSWVLSYKVEPEHTAINVSFEVDIPYSTFHEESLNVTLESHAFEFNVTWITPLQVHHDPDSNKVNLLVDIYDPMWVNLTKPWRRPDCWWTPDRNCYAARFNECVFWDFSPMQNWDPFFCYTFQIQDCLPLNTTSECYYLNTTGCLDMLIAEVGNKELLKCPLVASTPCIQINDRGLYYAQYDWTPPTPPPPPPGYKKVLCAISAEAVSAYREAVNNTEFFMEYVISQDGINGCYTVQMAAVPIVLPPYEPYKNLPTTDEYHSAKTCLNVNTTGYYTPPAVPIDWKDFNLTVSFTGEISNFIEINQRFSSNLVAGIMQRTKRRQPFSNASVMLEYSVKRPGVYLRADTTFSERDSALKHEKIDHILFITHPHAFSRGMEISITFEKLRNEYKMTFVNETISSSVGSNLLASTTTSMFNETHDGLGKTFSVDALKANILEMRSPSLSAEFQTTGGDEGIIDTFVAQVDPIMDTMDGLTNHLDVIKFWFSSRVLDVLPDDELKIPSSVEFKFAPNGGYIGRSTPKLTVTPQPFVPIVQPLYLDSHPDTGDDIIVTFDLSHNFEQENIYDIWMNGTCPDLIIVPGTLTMAFIEPVNVTSEGEYDQAIITASTFHIHLTLLDPAVNFVGNQTFHLWDNSMLTNQPVVCYSYLSYRKEGKSLVLPYEAGESPPITLPGIKMILHEKNLYSNLTMFHMPIGSNVTYIINITFPETSTKLTWLLTLPDGVLALWWSAPVFIGENIEYENATKTNMSTADPDIGVWNMKSRTEIGFDFGNVTNYADNVESQEDNLVVEFTVVLRDTEDVIKDSVHTLSLAVSSSNAKDLEDAESIHVLEPDVTQFFYLTNHSTIGDPGDVFQYYIHLNHTDASQTPAHHVIIRYSLPYMEVYQDFIPSNVSKIPQTKIFSALGPIQADSVLQLYLYKLDMDDIIEGTFLIQVSTKLSEGIAILGGANYSMQSFYHWGRLYEYTCLSQNLINIRNATLYFDGTSQPETPDDQITIHEQISYRVVVPVPPIPTNVTLKLDLPRKEVTMKRWEAEKLRASTVTTPPIEETFYDQGCYLKVLNEQCMCDFPSNGSVLEVHSKHTFRDCVHVAENNCTTFVNNTSSGDCPSNKTVDANCTQSEGCEVYQNLSIATPNCTNSSITEKVCLYSNTFVEQCLSTTAELCERNNTITSFWSELHYKNVTICKNVSSIESSTSAQNYTTDFTTPGAETTQLTTFPEDMTTRNPITLQCEEQLKVDCDLFALSFCNEIVVRNCSEEDVINTTVVSDSDRGLSCFCRDIPATPPISSWETNPYSMCESLADLPSNLTTVNRSMCSEDVKLNVSVATVLSTELVSSREGAVCHFVGGNRYDPFNPGVTYHAEVLPANVSDVGDSVSASVTAVILDHAELSRGDILVTYGTSVFTYISKPVPPNSIFYENCTCSRYLIDFYNENALMTCECETVDLKNTTLGKCNCSDSYKDEDEPFPYEYSCGCISFCLGNLSYFENPLPTFDIHYFNASGCNCALVESAMQDPLHSLQVHVHNCFQERLENYTCPLLNLTTTHHNITFGVNCTCTDEYGMYSCDCPFMDVHTQTASSFKDEVFTLRSCGDGTFSTDGEHFSVLMAYPNCSCPSPTTIHAITIGQSTTLFTTLEPEVVVFDCECGITCQVEVKEETYTLREGTHYYIDNAMDSFCSCSRRFATPDINVTMYLNYLQKYENTSTSEIVMDRSLTDPCLNATNATAENCTNSPKDIDVGSFLLDCYCFNFSRPLMGIPGSLCNLVPQQEERECVCLVPPDNETQFILDNWDYDALIVDEMITAISHNVTIVEPELQITFTRSPEPSVVDRLDVVSFNFDVTHTALSDAPAYDVYLLLDAINFTRNFASSTLEPTGIFSSEFCLVDNLCNTHYSNQKGLFHLPYFPVDPPGASFVGTFNLSVENHIDFVSDSLITAKGIVTYDSCLIDFGGRSYGPISSNDTVLIKTPEVQAKLSFTTAYAHLFYFESDDEAPQTFSVGDIVTIDAELWVPEVTLQVTNLTISSSLANFTILYGQVFLTDQIWSRNDTGSIYEELMVDGVFTDGLVYAGEDYTYALFKDGGLEVVPGVLVNEADNEADDDDFVVLSLHFRVNDISGWHQGVDIPFVISAVYLSTYDSVPVTLTDDSITLTVVEPKLHLQVEILDHAWQRDQVTSSAGYSCIVNSCCLEELCDISKVCVTDAENIEDCGSKECLCYSGYAPHEHAGCSALGRTSGDIFNFGLTVTHSPDFTGNAFDVLIKVHSELRASLISGAHFMNHPPSITFIESLSVPLLNQEGLSDFSLYINRFNHEETCERFIIPFRIDPNLRVLAAQSFSSNASMEYYSAKPYNMPTNLNKHSRFYEFEEQITFNFTAPAPSVRLWMEPPTENTTAIDFRIYSSASEDHSITVNLRLEKEVKFYMEFVLPKVETDISILMALPRGDGFILEDVKVSFEGSNVEFPSVEEGSEESFLLGLDSRQYWFKKWPSIYSQPNHIMVQRPFNGTIQRKFKNMHGETNPYPSTPSCFPAKSSLYEAPLLFGCFDNSANYFPVTMATLDHPSNYNHSKVMTVALCYKLCRESGYFVGGIYNASDCFCGNSTTLDLYKANARSYSFRVNETKLEDYVVQERVACNKTGIHWTNQTVTGLCWDRDHYDSCIADAETTCGNELYQQCMEHSLYALDCDKLAANHCNGSSENNCETTMSHSCQQSFAKICQNFNNIFCEHSLYNGSRHEKCYKESLEAYRQGFESSCVGPVENCTVEQIVLNNTLVEVCEIVMLNECTPCMYYLYENCTTQTEMSDNDCAKEASYSCMDACNHLNCSMVFYASRVIYNYHNCSWIESLPAEFIYESNCSIDVTKWKNVTREVTRWQDIPSSYCGLPCLGDNSTSCGGEDHITIVGLIDATLVSQSCDWYAGLYDEDEDVYTIKFTFEIEALNTKGVTEYLTPLVSYTHGVDKIPTLLPLAPFKLEAGKVKLHLYVWVSPRTSGYKPGDWLDYYTEVVHDENSTLTARDITIWWVFPAYIKYQNMTNHNRVLYDYQEIQPVTVGSMDHTKGLTFHLSTLRNSDVLSFHFRIQLDPDGTLAMGNYHMVAFAEMVYYTWDVYNPHENDYKHNVVGHFHEPRATQVDFQVPSTYKGRRQREDIQLKTYSFLYNENSNIFFACFFNNSINVYEGGCYMTGNLPLPVPDAYPSCEEFCNCTYFWGVKNNPNCTDYEPRPENCSCGCDADCFETQESCENQCATCKNCTQADMDKCDYMCTSDYTACIQGCCTSVCWGSLQSCKNDCMACEKYPACKGKDVCIPRCSNDHDDCVLTCLQLPATCRGNCSSTKSSCKEGCLRDCQKMISMNPNVEDNEMDSNLTRCLLPCQADCEMSNRNCTLGCCKDDCEANNTLCSGTCSIECGNGTACLTDCHVGCNVSSLWCQFSCMLEVSDCNQQCELKEEFCLDNCPEDCFEEVCYEEVVQVANVTYSYFVGSEGNASSINETTFIQYNDSFVFIYNETMDGNDTIKIVNCSSNGCSETYLNTTGNSSLVRRLHCEMEPSSQCSTLCKHGCASQKESCKHTCCEQQCESHLDLCDHNCQMNCNGDPLCLLNCGYDCQDDYHVCMVPCNLLPYTCKEDCLSQLHPCHKACDECYGVSQHLMNLTIPETPMISDLPLTTVLQKENDTRNTTSALNGDDGESCPEMTHSECLRECNHTVSVCSENCSCAEDCHHTHGACLLSCTGCREPCLADCRGNCSLTNSNCSSQCLLESYPVQLQKCVSTCANTSGICLEGCEDIKLLNQTVLCQIGCKDAHMNCTRQCFSSHPLTCKSEALMGTTDLPFPFSFTSSQTVLTDISMLPTTSAPPSTVEPVTVDILTILPEEDLDHLLDCTLACDHDYSACNTTLVTPDINNTAKVTQDLNSSQVCPHIFRQCTSTCIDHYITADCCKSYCDVLNSSCYGTCNACYKCWDVCQTGCGISHAECSRGCETPAKVDCNQYAQCISNCAEDEHFYNCSVTCLQVYVSQDCTLMSSCDELQQCMVHNRKKRSIPTVDRMESNVKGKMEKNNEEFKNTKFYHLGRKEEGIRKNDASSNVKHIRLRRSVADEIKNGSGNLSPKIPHLTPCELQSSMEDYNSCLQECVNEFVMLNAYEFCYTNCSSLAPTELSECCLSCNDTIEFCDNFCSNCSNFSDCSEMCDICYPRFSWQTCCEDCEGTMYDPHCLAACNSSSCPDLESPHWNCSCLNFTLLSVNDSCSLSEQMNLTTPAPPMTSELPQMTVFKNAVMRSLDMDCVNINNYQTCKCVCECHKDKPQPSTVHWRALHPSAGNILGLLNSTLFALSSNAMSIMRSYDSGQSWFAISDGEWMKARASPHFKEATRVDIEELILFEDVLKSTIRFSSEIWNDTFKVHLSSTCPQSFKPLQIPWGCG